jgi:hypothetical protein
MTQHACVHVSTGYPCSICNEPSDETFVLIYMSPLPNQNDGITYVACSPKCATALALIVAAGFRVTGVDLEEATAMSEEIIRTQRTQN